MIEKNGTYLQFPFVRYALIVGVLIALCSSLLGVTLVLKRFSFIGDGLSHVAFGAIAIASVLHLSDNMLFVMPVTVLCAVLLLKTGQNTRIKGDAAIAMISVGALALGYLLMKVFWGVMLQKLGGYFAFIMTPDGFVKEFVLVTVAYLIINICDFIRIRNIPKVLALKHAE